MNDHESRPSSRPVPISTAEFDRKIEAGEDIDIHLDWDNAVIIEPGEPSPEQKLAMVWEESSKEIDLNGKASESSHYLNIPLPQWAFDQLQSDASRQGIRQEELAQLFILQRLDKQTIAT